MKKTLAYLPMICTVLATSGELSAQDFRSQISVPLTADLSGISSFVEARLPKNPLYRNDYGRTCVEPERVCTKVPEFRGLKVTMKNRCAEVTPRIDCTITEHIERQGPLEIVGSGPTISVRQDIFGSGTVRGRGEVGKHIRQTVRAKAEFTVTATPKLNADWTVEPNVRLNHRWLQRPEFRLFNIFPVSIGSQLDPPLNDAMRRFEAELPAHLAALDIRSKAAGLWSALQAPQPMEIGADRQLYLHLRPDAIKFQGVEINGSALESGLSIALSAAVDSNPEGPPRTNLPNLSSFPNNGVRFVVPVHLDFDVMDRLFATQLPVTFDLAGNPATVSRVNASTDGVLLVLQADVQVAGGPLAALSGLVEFRARPTLAADGTAISFTGIAAHAVEGGLSGLARNAAIQLATAFLDDVVTVSISQDIETASQRISAAMNRQLTAELALEGNGDVSVEALSLKERPETLTVTLRLDGQARVVGFQPLR